ncbi:hypothetical protein BP6252_09341 [Coleophoma cylindrospora]|uniref:Uncharacterized protein n=1 Tax=Coleophoma cylindrospora TaxID=1849047 RepID=A0A3D8R1M8_9HELO|nr:hypothetical protein BP6252_09341 [Coleophoma cylindrospora]
MPPSKVQKTERTHEENQERAYIAASRRSDRSLEARVESARRASEIHKKRTGRALKVTEQDVLNEEMYEEEEDDLPYPYRRLMNAQLQTGSPEFNHRLSTYLTNHLAMRTALEQSIANSYQLQNGSNMSYNYNPQLMFPSPMFAHQPPTQQQAMPLQSPHQQQPHSPSGAYRHAPYPQPNPYQGQHHRSASIAVPQELNGSQKGSPSLATMEHQRRMSLPAAPGGIAHATPPTTASNPSTPVLESPGPGRPPPKQRPSFSQGTFDQLKLHPAQHQQIPNQQFYPSYNMNPNMGSTDFGFLSNIYPLTTQPSAETEMFLGAQFHSGNHNTGLDSTMLGDNKYAQLENFDFNGSFSMPPEHESPIKTENQSKGLDSSASANEMLPFSASAQNHFFNEAFEKGPEASPSGTPGLNADMWDSFIDFSLPSSSQ